MAVSIARPELVGKPGVHLITFGPKQVDGLIRLRRLERLLDVLPNSPQHAKWDRFFSWRPSKFKERGEVIETVFEPEISFRTGMGFWIGERTVNVGELFLHLESRNHSTRDLFDNILNRPISGVIPTLEKWRRRIDSARIRPITDNERADFRF